MKIAGNAPLAVRQARQSIHHGLQMSLTDGMAFEVVAYNQLVSTADRYEGVLAFNEKRKPEFTGTWADCQQLFMKINSVDVYVCLLYTSDAADE